MKTLTIDKWSIGIDVRKPASVSSANRLVDLKNAYINTGKTITKRKGTILLGATSNNTFGLFSANGVIHVFGTVAVGSVTVPSGVQYNQIGYSGMTLTGIHSAVLFNGFVFVCADYSGTSRYHYLDGTSLDGFSTDCPHKPVFTVSAGKIFAEDDDIVRYCEVGDPRLWDGVQDAGFIATGNFTDNSTSVTALKPYLGSLIVMHNNTSLEWAIEPNPDNTALKTTILEGSQEHRSLANVTGDLYFLSEAGFRSIAVQSSTGNLADIDVGSVIDKLVAPIVKTGAISIYNHKEGQFWCAVDGKVWVYSFSKTAKLSAWSYYEYAFTVDDMIMHNNEVIFRSGDNIYKTDGSVYTDNGTDYEVVAELSQIDFKDNSALKQIHGFDVSQVGTCQAIFSMGIETQITTHTVTITGDFRDSQMIALPVIATHIQPKFINKDSNFWEMNLVNIMFNKMGVL